MISVCIATHNGELYIEDQLLSILNQIGPTDEIVISDDGSTDKTVDIIKSINDSRIRIYQFIHQNDYSNKRLSSYYYATENFSNALKYAKGDYIFLSDQDDIWHIDKVKICLNELKNSDIVVHNFSILNDTLKDTDNYLNYKTHFNIFDYIYKLPFRGCCMAFNRKVYNLCIPIPKGTFMHDCYIGLKSVMANHNYKFIDKPLIFYRRHNNNVSDFKSKNNLFFKIIYRIKLIYSILLH